MKTLPTLALSLVLSLGTVAVLHAQDAAPAPAAENKPAKVVKVPRVTGIWAKMDSLTNEQKIQIATLHRQALADKKAIDAKEETDIVALLSPEQKVELEKAKEDLAAARRKAPAKPGEAAKPDGETPATPPAEEGM